MNPLKKLLLGILAGIAIALLFTRGRDISFFIAMVPSTMFILVGLTFGWQFTMRCAGKALNIGTNLTFWVFFLCLFRRGLLFGSLFLLVIVSMAFTIGCIAGVFVAAWEIGNFIFLDRNAWKEKITFPSSDASAYLLLLGWFALYNRQNISEYDLDGLLEQIQGQPADYESVFLSLKSRNIEDLYQAILLYKRPQGTGEDSPYSLLLSKMLHGIYQSGRITCQAKEFLLMLGECYGFSWKAVEEVYLKSVGEPFPDVYDPSILSGAVQRNDKKTRAALRTLGLPEDFELDGKNASDEVHQAYRTKARQHHPDLNPDEDGRQVAEVIEAYNFLKEKIKYSGQ